MTFANCPKCGSSNVTTAGVCANCGWTRFPQVMGAGESEEAVYELVGEIEIKVTGKALLDDYKRLLFENRNLKERVAELEALVERLIEIGDWATIGMVISNSYSLTSETRKLAEDRHDEWRMLVKGWKSSKQKEAYDLDEYKDNPEEREI